MAFTSPRKQVRGKRHLPDVPSDSPRVKAVSFDDKVVETSIGGTQTLSKVKGDPLVPVRDASRNVDSRSDASSHLQHSQGSISAAFSVKTAASASQARTAKTTGQGLQTENKENVEQAEEGKSTKPNKTSDDVFASPVGRPAKSALLMKEFEKFTPTKTNSRGDSVRRTTQEYLEQVPDAFVTPPNHQMRRHTLETKMFATPDCYRAVQMETPRKCSLDLMPGADDSITEADSGDGEDSCSITVAVRVRPYSQRELSDPSTKCVVSMSGNETTVTAENGSVHRFAFDFSFWSFDRGGGAFADQGQVYQSLAQPLLGKAFEGYNTCLFAYGQTGSGKSYSIMGHGHETGIIPRFCEELFSRAVRTSNKDKVKINVEISFFEIYNEKIHDLLASSKEKNGRKTTLKVREHPVLGPYVEGLSTFVVNSFEDVEGWITLGTKNRATAATGMNDKSSRSHSVFTIVLTQTRTERVENQDHDHSITSKINLVDLAGSERQSQAQTTGERLREGANINKSLMTLGKVISVLSERSAASKKRKIFIPYRDSVLTWLLKESLGGNSKTAMIATISPSHQHTEESLSTLRYARQTRSIVNMVRVNEDPKAKIIRELRAEIEKLRSQSGGMNDDAHMLGLAEIAMLREKLMSKEKEMDELSRSWQERLRQAEARKLEESRQLEKSGVAAAVKVDNQMPNLVNLNEDPQLSELLLYVIKTGQTRVGRKRTNSSHDIQLSGALIADNHCIINNMEGIVNITPIGDAPTYVNGNLILEPTILHHADRVILGGDHYFRFNHPMEVKKGKKSSGTTEVKDFEFAKQELLRVQEAKLQAELAEARKAAQAQMEEELERARLQAEMELSQQRTGYEGRLADMEKTLKEQSLEVQRAEQSKQEAHSLIEDLRKQKMMLEQEVLAGRKRQQLEAEAAKKVNSEIVSNKSKILELLETERSKAATRLEELRQRRAEMVTPTKKRRGGEEGAGSVGIRKDLYKVALLLREANKISQYLKKNLMFSREDLDDEGEEGETGESQTLIKVTNTHHRIFTHWTVAKLEEKVVQMRDLYQNDGESSSDDEEVFNDPDDTWEKENPSPSNSPSSGSVLHKSVLSSVSLLNSSASGTPLSKRGSFGLSSSMSCTDASVYKACRKMVSSVIDQLNALSFEETIADKILWDCHMIKSCVSAIMGSDQNPSTPTNASQWSPVQLVSGLQLLSSHCCLWAGGLDRDTPLVRDLLTRLTEQVRALGVSISHLLQGYETDLCALVQESAGKVSAGLADVCGCCGQLALATKTRIVRLEQFTQHSPTSQLNAEVCRAFLAGCDQLLDQSLQRGLRTLGECEKEAEKLTSSTTAATGSQETTAVCRDVQHTVMCTRVLLQACQEVQAELDSSLANGRESVSSDRPRPVQGSYRRMQALLTHVSGLADTSSLLLQVTQTVVKGDSRDLRRIHRCGEVIHKRAQQLLSCCCSDGASLSPSLLTSPSHPPHDTAFHIQDSTTPRSIPSRRSSHLDSVSSLSDSQMEHLDFAMQEVVSSSRALMERVQTLSSPHRDSSTPLRRRMLPASPEKATITPMMHLQRASVKRNLPLAGAAADS